MGLPNGIGELLTKDQNSLLAKAGGKLFSADKAKSPSDQLTKEQLKDYAIKPKAKPTIRDVAKLSAASGMGFLLLNSTLEKAFKLDGSSAKTAPMENNLLSNLLGGPTSLLSSLLGLGGKKMPGLAASLAAKGGIKTLLTKSLVGPLGAAAMIVGGVLLAVGDGIRGSKKAKEWGVSKFNAGLSSALTSSSSGLKGAALGAAKYGLIGAGLGSIIPGVGTIVGGVIGTGIGAILGAVGGKRTAQFFKMVGDGVSKNFITPFKKMGQAIGDLVGRASLGALNFLDKSGKTAKIWQSDLGVGKKMLFTLGRIGEGAWNLVSTGLTKGIGFVKDRMTDLTTKDDGSLNTFGKIVAGIKSIPDNLLKGLDGLGAHIVGEEQWNNLKTFFTDKVFGGVKKFFEGVGSWIKKLFGLQESSEEQMAKAAWEKKFKASEEYQKLDERRRNATLEGGFFDIKSAMEEIYQAEKLKDGKPSAPHDDAIFSLEKSLTKGNLFQGHTSEKFNRDDDLYLMASTNPARDALASSVDNLAALVAQLALTMQAYRPQTNNMSTTVQSSNIPMRDLLAIPERG